MQERIQILEARITLVEIEMAKMVGALSVIKWVVPIVTPALTAGLVLLVNWLTRKGG